MLRRMVRRSRAARVPAYPILRKTCSGRVLKPGRKLVAKVLGKPRHTPRLESHRNRIIELGFVDL